jgi:hypothetical protein
LECSNTDFNEQNISKEAIEKNIPAGFEEGGTAEEEGGQNGSIAMIPSERMIKRDMIRMKTNKSEGRKKALPAAGKEANRLL